MSVFSEGFTCNVGNGASPEVFSELGLLEAPEVKTGARATFPRRKTSDTGNTKKYGVGLEDGDELSLVCEMDLDDTAQDSLRTALANGTEVNLQFIFNDGTTTQTDSAAFLVTSSPIQPTDPNGDGENVRQTFNVKRNSDWSSVES